jgi:fibro-slime domain-containing protein
MGTGGLPSVGSCPLSETGLTLAATFRDFQAAHPDFEPSAPGGGEVVTGIVDDALGPDGVPVQVGSGPGITSEATFNQWFRDVPGVNAPIVRQLVLWNDGQGGYVNRWGSSGEQWESYENPVYCAIAATNCEACQPLGEGVRCLFPCDRFGTYECAINVETYDGTPVFFPIDNAPGAITSLSEYSIATIPTAYGGLWQPEPGGSPHNFHFTSEIRFWFRYNGTTHIIELLGDDDVWVFINGRLVIDLGGLHTPLGGTFTLDTNRATELGLTSPVLRIGDLPCRAADFGLFVHAAPSGIPVERDEMCTAIIR